MSRPEIRAILERSANDRALNIYERVYCAFVCVEAGWSSALSTWEELRDQLDPQLADKREHLHQYRQGDRWEYIHIPWEIYYVQLGLALEGVRWDLRPRVQRWLLGAISDVMSDGGYTYKRPGVKSTRTYAALMEMFTEINRLTSTSFAFNQFASLWNGISRAYFSRFLRVLLFIAGVGLAVVSTVDWVRGPTSSLGDLGPKPRSAGCHPAIGAVEAASVAARPLVVRAALQV